MSFSVEGKTTIVTGAANGIGLAIAKHFAEEGANVMFADMDDESLKKELGEECESGNVRYFSGDLRERLTIANLLSATIDAFERVDILINASRQVLLTDPLDLEDETIAVMWQQNVLNSFRLSQHVAKRMIKQSEDETEADGIIGTIVNLSSIASTLAQPRLLGYSIATAAMDQMTRSLAVSLAPNRIRVNSLAIGSIMSASLQNSLKDADELRQDIEAHTPMGRIASASEIVETVQYLAAPASGFVTGQIITVDGGRCLLDPVSSPFH